MDLTAHHVSCLEKSPRNPRPVESGGPRNKNGAAWENGWHLSFGKDWPGGVPTGEGGEAVRDGKQNTPFSTSHVSPYPRSSFTCFTSAIEHYCGPEEKAGSMLAHTRLTV